MAVCTISNAGGNWNATTAWTGGVVPTAADDVVATITSGNLSIPSSYTALCRSINLFGFTGTLTHASGSAALTVGTSTPGPSNVALFFPTSLVYAQSSAVVSFVSTSSTQQTIDFGGKTQGQWTIAAVGGNYIQSRAATCTAFVLTAGTFDTGNYAMSATTFTVSGASAKTLTLGSSSIAVTAAGGVAIANTGLTFTTCTATFTLSAANASFATTSVPSLPGLSVVYTGAGSATHNCAASMANLTRTGTNTGARVDNLTIYANVVLSGAFVANGNSEVDRVLVMAATSGVPYSIMAASTTVTNVDFMDVAIITAVGSTITSDSFNRSDGQLHGTNTDAANGGSASTWETFGLGGTTFWRVASNKATMTSGSATSFSVVNAASDVAVSAVVTPDAGTYHGVVARAIDPNNYILAACGVSGLLRIVVGGVMVYNAGMSNCVAGDTLKLIVVGSMAVVYRNTTLIASASVPSSLAGTKAGIGTLGSMISGSVDNIVIENQPSATGTSLGDCGGNSGITFTPGATQYYVTSASANWSDATKWASSSGGTGGTGRVPLPQDDVRFDANSVTAAGRIISIDVPRIGRNVDLTGAAVSGPTLAPALSSTTMYGTLTWASGVTAGQSSSPWVFAGRGTHTITMNGVVPLNWAMTVTAPNGSYSLGGALTLGGASPGVFTVSAGTFNTNSYTMVVGAFASGGSLTRAVYLGTSSITLTAAAGNWTISGTGLTLSAASATIAFGVSLVTRSFAGNGFTYGTLDYSVANSSGALGVTGGNTFGTVNIGPGRALNLAASAVHTIGEFNTSGSNYGYLNLNGSLTVTDTITAPDSAALRIAGDITIEAKLWFDDWANTAPCMIVSKLTAGLAGGYGLRKTTLGRLELFVGGTQASSSVSLNTALTSGVGYVRADWTDATNVARFWTSPDGVTWTQLGSNVTLTGAGVTSTDVMYFGMRQGGNDPQWAKGRLYRVQIWSDTTRTTKVMDANFANKVFGADTLVDASANAATISLTGNVRNTDGRVAISSATSGTPTLLTLPGDRRSYDYLVVKDVISTIPYKFYAGANSIDVSGNTNVTITTTPTDDPFIVFDAEVNLNGTLTNTINLNIPPNQGVSPYDHIVLIFHSTNVHAGVAAPGLTAVSPAAVSDTSATTSILTGLAVGNETGKVVTHASGGLAGTIRLLVVRGAANVEGVASAVGGNVSTTTASTGTLSSSLPASIAIASVGATGTLGATLANSNGFQQARVLVAETGNYLRVSAKPLPTPGSVTTSTTWTTARTRNVGRLLILRPDSNGVLQSSFMPFFG